MPNNIPDTVDIVFLDNDIYCGTRQKRSFSVAICTYSLTHRL
jgi:hypothetical protein